MTETISEIQSCLRDLENLSDESIGVVVDGSWGDFYFRLPKSEVIRFLKQTKLLLENPPSEFEDIMNRYTEETAGHRIKSILENNAV